MRMFPERLATRTACVLAALSVLAAAPSPAAAGAILNTLDGYDARALGWSGGLEGRFSGSGGNTETLNLAAGGRVQWRGGRDRIRLQSSVEYEESGGRETERDVVAHLRHNRTLSPAWATVAFAQVQHNPFQRLQRRWLLGGGVRRDLYDDDRGHVRLGVTPMLEVERLEGGGPAVARGRLSTFLQIGRRLSDAARLDLVAFWQPLFDDLADFRATADATLTVAVSGAVDLKVGVSVTDDARPPAGVERTDWQTYLGLALGF